MDSWESLKVNTTDSVKNGFITTIAFFPHLSTTPNLRSFQNRWPKAR